jgi:hypothetical protein
MLKDKIEKKNQMTKKKVDLSYVCSFNTSLVLKLDPIAIIVLIQFNFVKFI